MDNELLITAIEFYLRQQRQFTRARSDPSQQLSDWAEQALWDYAQEAAGRLGRLRRRAALRPEPVPVRRSANRAPRTRHDPRTFPPSHS